MIVVLFAIFLLLFVVLPLVGLALWTLISTAIVGLIIGALARLVIPGRQSLGAVGTILSGLVGAIVGGAIGRGIGTGHIATLVLEIAVAVLAVLAITGAEKRRTSHRP
ncbi:MAG: GlsB/YeaQ/YmgE family stress response membrane protein [Acidimicrobiales bacterium]